jgi:hypothetical protein
MGFAHPESGTAVAYVCNSMLWNGFTGPDQRWLKWTKALREANWNLTGAQSQTQPFKKSEHTGSAMIAGFTLTCSRSWGRR